MILAEKLSKSYHRKPVLQEVSLQAHPGQITLLLGPNGAGKSTTMRLLTGLARPDSGSALIAGRDIVREKMAAQSALSFLPQTPSFHPRFTCEQIIAFYARLRGIPDERRRAVLELVGLTEASGKRTGALSGGMRQRLGLALLLLPQTPVLLLDEPGISLDPAWRRRLQGILHDEARAGRTVLVTTHLIGEWNNVAHRALLCRGGRMERELDPANLPYDFVELEEPEALRSVPIPGESTQPRSHAA